MLAFEVHARRLAALKALTSASTSSSEMMEKIYEIVFGILEKVSRSFNVNHGLLSYTSP